jgi:hypothetical protein
VASDFDGDDSGRFAFKEYRLQQRMAWWPAGHAKFAQWRNAFSASDGTAVEACTGECESCRADLFGVIRFADVTPIALEAVGLDADWPAGFSR